MRREDFTIKTAWYVCACSVIVFAMLIKPCVAAEDLAQFPSKPITMILHFSPGSATDLTGRKLAELGGKILGQVIVPESKVGGSGIIGLNAVAQAKPDGYTIGTISASATVVVPHFQKVPYNPKEDFTWLIHYGDFPLAFCVLPNARWKTFKDFVEEARKNPGKLTYATTSARGANYASMERIGLQEKAKFTHVPLQSGTEVISQVLGGHVDASLTPELVRYLPAGQVRALAVYDEKRWEICPDVPTFSELGYKVESPSFIGLCAPKNLPPEILQKLHAAFKKASEDPSFKELLKTLVMTPVYRDPESFKRFAIEHFDNQRKTLQEIGLIK